MTAIERLKIRLAEVEAATAGSYLEYEWGVIDGLKEAIKILEEEGY